MKSISFYKTVSGKCPVEDHLNSLSDQQVTKITWVLKLIRETDNVSTNFFQKKTQKTPSKEIKLAEQRMKDYLSRR